MSEGAAISIKNGNLIVPEEPLIHYIEGDGIGIDITPVMINVVDAAVETAYSDKRKIHWNEVKYLQAKKHSIRQENGYPKKLSKP